MGNAFFRGLLANQAQDASDTSDEGLEPKYLLEQYASQVLDFSTQYGSDRSFSYTAANCLGACSCLTTNKFFTQFWFDNSFNFRSTRQVSKLWRLSSDLCHAHLWSLAREGITSNMYLLFCIKNELHTQSPGGCLRAKLRSVGSTKLSTPSEFIDLKFEYALFVHAVYIYETLNPGSVTAIWAGKVFITMFLIACIKFHLLSK